MIQIKIIRKKSKAGLMVPVSLIVLFTFLLASTVWATLSCVVDTACANVTVFKMSATSNAHAELAAQANYDQLVCCSGETGLGNSCAGTYAVVAKLSGTSNAHVEENTEANYAQSACLSIDSGTVSVAYQNTNCDGYHATVASMSGATTNAHVGDSTAYTRKICASAAAAAAISISVTSDGTIDYQTVEWSSQQDTITLVDTQTVEVGAGGPVNLEVQTTNATGGAGWALASTIGVIDQYVHEFSTTTVPTWVKFPTPAETYKTATTSVATGNSQDFDFRITVPDETTDFDPKSITITIHAVES